MKELNFEKQGLKFCFKNFTYEDNKLKAQWKVVGIKESKYTEDGYCYNAIYDEKMNAFRIEFNYKNKKVNGVKLPNEITIDEILEDAKKFAEIKATEALNKLNTEYVDDKILDISFCTSYDFSLGKYAKSTRGIAIAKLLADGKIAAVVKNLMSDFQTGCDYGDYSITYDYQISVIKFENIVNETFDKIETERKIKKENKEAERKAIFDKAKTTGEKQVLSHWSEDCNDPNEECNVDIIYVYAMPDGTTKQTRNHTW